MRGVIAVIVRHEQPERGPWHHQVAAERAHLPNGTRRIHPRVDEKALTTGLDDQAIAGRAASEDPNFHATGIPCAIRRRK